MIGRAFLLVAPTIACAGELDPQVDLDTVVDDSGETDQLDTALAEAPDPGPPTFPDVIDHLTVTIRTGDSRYAGSDATKAYLCLTADHCVRLDVPDVDDLRVGEVDVYHASGLGLARADVSRVQIRTETGSDMWRPACMAIAFDGEPVYCNDALDVKIGNGGRDEVTDWRDPAGLHLACTTCEPAGTLTHGPMVGATTTDKTRIWVRTDATRRVGLRMSEDADLAEAPVVAWAHPHPKSDFAAVMEVRGLKPDTTYHYGVEVDGRIARRSTLKSAPTTPGKRRFALGSCTKYDEQPIFAVVDRFDPDVFVFLGDNHYANSSDLGALRWNYRRARAMPERAALLDHTVTLATWDDHDFVGNNTDASDPGGATAARAFAEYWANPSYGVPDAPGVATATPWGDVLFVMVDGRTHRGLDGRMLGKAQADWLVDTLAASDATFKLVVSGSQWSDRGSGDSWASFKGERDAIFAELDRRGVPGVVLVSGDIHRSEFDLLGRSSGYHLPELTSSPMATFKSVCRGGARDCYAGSNSFVLVDVDTSLSDPTLTATIHDDEGAVKATWVIRASDLR